MIHTTVIYLPYSITEDHSAIMLATLPTKVLLIQLYSQKLWYWKSLKLHNETTLVNVRQVNVFDGSGFAGWLLPKRKGESNSKWKINTNKVFISIYPEASETQKGPGPHWRYRISLWGNIFYGTPPAKWSDRILSRTFKYIYIYLKTPFNQVYRLFFSNIIW